MRLLLLFIVVGCVVGCSGLGGPIMKTGDPQVDHSIAAQSRAKQFVWKHRGAPYVPASPVAGSVRPSKRIKVHGGDFGSGSTVYDERFDRFFSRVKSLLEKAGGSRPLENTAVEPRLYAVLMGSAGKFIEEEMLTGDENTIIRFRSVTPLKGDVVFGRAYGYRESEEPEELAELDRRERPSFEAYTAVLEKLGVLSASGDTGVVRNLNLELGLVLNDANDVMKSDPRAGTGTEKAGMAAAIRFVFKPARAELFVQFSPNEGEILLMSGVEVASATGREEFATFAEVSRDWAVNGCKGVVSSSLARQVNAVMKWVMVRTGEPGPTSKYPKCAAPNLPQLKANAIAYVVKKHVIFDGVCEGAAVLAYFAESSVTLLCSSVGPNVVKGGALGRDAWIRAGGLKTVPKQLLHAKRVEIFSNMIDGKQFVTDGSTATGLSATIKRLSRKTPRLNVIGG